MVQTLAQHLTVLPVGSVLRVAGSLDLPVNAPFVEDSRDVIDGSVFVARKGDAFDGHNYIDQAIERGAIAVVGEATIDVSVPYIQISHAHLATGRLAASYYGFPSRKMLVYGVTGTNGKTTTIHLLHSILQRSTKDKAGFISTIAANFGGAHADTGLHVTTPSAPDIQRYLAQMVEAGLTHVVLEMTSHGLAQGRLSGVDVDVAILTNLTHEHLDYHGSFEAYRAAKGLLFKMLAESYRKPDVPKVAVINMDDPSAEYFSAFPVDLIAGYSIDTPSTYRAQTIDYQPTKTVMDVDKHKAELQLVGAFNVYNALAAIAAARATKVRWNIGRKSIIGEGLSRVAGVSGRMERIDEGQNFTAIVDFAHTPDALEKALTAGRSMLKKRKRLIAVFGSAGLRDVEKRRMMAEVSAQLADITILTAEDPRTESLNMILGMMAEGCILRGGAEGESFYRIPDRGAAIFKACQLARKGDVVMVCGKGHEQSMCFETTEYPWDDREALRSALQGQPLRTLPTAEDVGA